jgi:hypothetical protein
VTFSELDIKALYLAFITVVLMIKALPGPKLERPDWIDLLAIPSQKRKTANLSRSAAGIQAGTALNRIVAQTDAPRITSQQHHSEIS